MDAEKLAQYARAALKHFTATVRTSTMEPIVTLRDDAQQWVLDLVRHAHGNLFLPDDHRYQMIQDVLQALDDTEGDVDEARLALEAPTYTSELATWLGSNGYRLDYCDEATEEYGPFKRTFDLLAAGYSMEVDEVFGLVVSFLSALEIEVLEIDS